MLENPKAITKRGTFANQGLNYLNNCSIIGPKRSLPVGNASELRILIHLISKVFRDLEHPFPLLRQEQKHFSPMGTNFCIGLSLGQDGRLDLFWPKITPAGLGCNGIKFYT